MLPRSIYWAHIDNVIYLKFFILITIKLNSSLNILHLLKLAKYVFKGTVQLISSDIIDGVACSIDKGALKSLVWLSIN